MSRTLGTVWTLAALALTGGCMAAPAPLVEPPVVAAPGLEVAAVENPYYVHLDATFVSYKKVFDATLSTLNDFGFVVIDSNMYDGRIETAPRVAPGLGLFLRPGSPDCWDRLLATTQSYRHRCFVVVQPAQQGGYFVALTVFKELEDLPRPIRATTGSAIFRNDNNIERQFEVIDPTVFESNWIPRGRDTCVEQLLLDWLRKRLG